ncbi:MAG: hypothetical protein H6R11_1564 [Proteobacteria bacterium]|jgi:rubrerythrin|nr:hypothetical protein [Pseudomonadota bacterium]
MGSSKPIGTIAECYAHAVAMEREAATRYAEFAELMAERGEEATAALFEQLARFDARQADLLAERAARMTLPRIPSLEHSWVDDAPPEAVSHEPFHLLTAHDALQIALRNKQRSKALFEQVATSAEDAEAKDLAAEMSVEEAEHIRRLRDAIARTPTPLVWDERMLEALPLH